VAAGQKVFREVAADEARATGHQTMRHQLFLPKRSRAFRPFDYSEFRLALIYATAAFERQFECSLRIQDSGFGIQHPRFKSREARRRRIP
jgi:hypothetical protein